MALERSEESVPPRLRRSRAWALAAFLALVTSLWLPWWSVTYEDDAGFEYDGVAARPFGPEPPATTEWAPHATGVLAAVATAWLFVRLAGRSHAYEPRAWRRDACLQSILVALAWLSALLWPSGVPSFWGGRTFDLDGASFTETALPGLGWWLALLAAVLLGVAWWTARPPAEAADGATGGAEGGPEAGRDRSMDSP